MNLRAILLIFIGIHTSSKAVNLQINEELTLRVGSNSNGESHYTGQPVGILPKGSIVDIPDQYIVRDSSGKVDIDFTLNKWFKEGGKTFLMKNGLNVFHTPIDVIHPKLDPSLSGKEIHVTLQNLKLKNTSSTAMNVIEDSELLSVLEAPDETEAGSICSGVCALSNENMDQNTQDFISKMREFSENVIPQEVVGKTIRKSQVLSRDAKHLDSSLQTHCGISQAEMAGEIEKMIKENGLPFTCNELMGLLLMESSGRCRALNIANSNKTSDMGLFQINSINFDNDIQTGRAKICKNKEFQKLKAEAKKSKDAIAFWKAQPKPQCINNPMYSLRKGIFVLSTNKNFFRRYKNHPDLFRRFILSGYNGGQGNVAKALRDLEIYNSDLQKRLAEGGKDITRSNRGVRKIKEEIRTIDSGIASVNQSLRSLNSNIKKIENTLSRVNRVIPQTEQFAQNKVAAKEHREQQLQDIPGPVHQRIAQRSSQVLPAVQQEVSRNEGKLAPLVLEWNTLNKQEASAIAQQQKILLFLDRQLQHITDQRRNTDPLSRKGKLLALRGQTLERFISEVEEEKWPYYMDSLLQISVQKPAKEEAVAQTETPQPADKGASQTQTETPQPADKGASQAQTETPQPADKGASQAQTETPQPAETDSMIERIKGYKEGALQFANTHGKNLGNMVRDIHKKITATVTGSAKDPEWDFYQIHALEKQLEEKHNLVRRRGPQRTDSALMHEISEIQQKISSAKKQRSKDIENILDQNYRNQMSQEEKARALKIIESEIETMAVNANREFDKQLDDWTTLQDFFYPRSILNRLSRIDQLEDIQRKIIDKDIKKVQHEPNENTQKNQRETASKNTQEAQRTIASKNIEDIQREDNIDEENESVRYLFSIMAKKPAGNRPHSTYLSALQKLENSRTRIDKKRKDLEENAFFQTIKPFLSGQRRRDGTRSLVIGARARLFYTEQARTQHNRKNLHKEIRDINKMLTASSITSGEIEVLQEHISKLKQELDNLRAEKQQQEKQRRILLTDQIDKLDQEDILQKQLEQAQSDLATSRKDPLNWDDIKLFFFSAELQKGIENSGLRSTRSKGNAITNISYIDGLLGTKSQPGFMQTNEAKKLCPRPKKS